MSQDQELKKHLNYLIEVNKNRDRINIDSIKDFITNVSNILGIKKKVKSITQQNSLTTDTHYLGQNKLLVKLEFGWICVNTFNLDVATGIVKDRVIEPWNGQLIKEILKPGDSFINVGANFGYFTILGASLVGNHGKVLSFEANPLIYDCLSYGIFYSGYPHIIDAYNYAASDGEEVMDFTFNPIFSGGGSLVTAGSFSTEDIKSELSDCLIPANGPYYNKLINGGWDRYPFLQFKTQSKKIDDIFLGGNYQSEKLKLIQIDVEGAESMVLSGLKKTIELTRPQLIVEFDPSTLSVQINQFDKEAVLNTFRFLFEDMNYEVYQILPTLPYSLKKVETLNDMIDLPHGDLYFK